MNYQLVRYTMPPTLPNTKHWYLLHTRPRQELCARENLERQNYTCYLPLLSREKIVARQIQLQVEPLFARYLFIQLDSCASAPSWTPIRSTRGVSRLITFGTTPAQIPDQLINELRQRELAGQTKPLPLFQKGTRVRLTQGAFAGIEGIYELSDGAQRALVLISMLGTQARIAVPAASLRKAG